MLTISAVRWRVPSLYKKPLDRARTISDDLATYAIDSYRLGVEQMAFEYAYQWTPYDLPAAGVAKSSQFNRLPEKTIVHGETETEGEPLGTSVQHCHLGEDEDQ